MDRTFKRPVTQTWIPAGAGALVLVGATVAYFIWAAPGARTLTVENATIQVSEVTRGAFEDFIPIRGRVTPSMTVYMDVIEGGTVEKVYAEDGAVLKAGDRIVDLTNTSLQLDVLARESEVTQQLNNLREIELNLERDRQQRAQMLVDMDYQITRLDRVMVRRQALVKSGAVSRVEHENTADELAYYRAKREITVQSQRTAESLQREQLREMRAATAQLEKNLQIARRTLEGLNVKAPVDGTLTAFTAEVGQSLARGARLGQVDDPAHYKISAEVEEFYLGRVDIGQTAMLTSASRTYALKVAKIYPQVRDGRFTVDFAFTAGQPDDIRRGQTLALNLTLGDTVEALLVPDGAFFQDTGGAWMFVVSPNGGEAVRRTVRSGRRNARYIEILGGLEAGEHVVTSPYSGFLDKDRLDLRK